MTGIANCCIRNLGLSITLMSAASRVKPEQFFDEQEWAWLSARSSWKGITLVLHCWLVIACAMATAIAWPLTAPLMIMMIGNRQLGLFILMHDAAHGLLHPNRKLNDAIALWFCGAELNVYRPYHLQHHRFVQQSEDPDLVLSAPFPVTRKSLSRKIIRDLTGQTFFKQRFGALAHQLRSRTQRQSMLSVVLAEAKRQKVFLLLNGLGLLAFALAGLAWAWLLLWLLPMASWLPLVTRLRNIAEHALIEQNGTDPLRHARTTRASMLERLFIAPYWVNFHCEHHLFTQIPCWNLAAAHRLLCAKGVTSRMEVQPGYAAVMRLASSA